MNKLLIPFAIIIAAVIVTVGYVSVNRYEYIGSSPYVFTKVDKLDGSVYTHEVDICDEGSYSYCHEEYKALNLWLGVDFVMVWQMY